MAQKTLADYERYLNEHFADQDDDTVRENHIYLTNPSRGKHCTKTRLNNAIYDRTVGTLLRKLDPIAFNVGFNDYN